MLQLRILFFCLESLPARISQSKSATYIAFLITHPRIRPVWVVCVSCVADSWDRDFGVIRALKKKKKFDALGLKARKKKFLISSAGLRVFQPPVGLPRGFGLLAPGARLLGA